MRTIDGGKLWVGQKLLCGVLLPLPHQLLQLPCFILIISEVNMTPLEAIAGILIILGAFSVSAAIVGAYHIIKFVFKKR